MDLFNRTNFSVERTARTSIWTSYDEGHAEWVAQTFILSPGGVYHLNERYTDVAPQSLDLYYNAYLRGVFSPRPYLLQRISDNSIGFCVLEMFRDFCVRRQVNAADIFARVYPEAPLAQKDWEAIHAQARWEGQVPPRGWTTEDILALRGALFDIDYGRLSHQVEIIAGLRAT